MKSLVNAGLSIVALIAFVALGVASWTLWDENQRLRADLSASDVQLNKIAADYDRERLSLRQMTEAKESVERNLVSAQQTLEETKRRLAELQKDKRRVDFELATERRQARERAAAMAKEAAKRAEEVERTVKVEAVHLREEDPLADVGTLKQLLELTDQAPRRSAD